MWNITLLPKCWLLFWEIWCGFFYQEFMLLSGGGAVQRRAVFILGAKWIALVRGWRRNCVVGGMETRFQWRKAHSRPAKCEAFHVSPRLFFMFLFLIPFTIRQYCIIYPQEFSTEPLIFHWAISTDQVNLWGRNNKPGSGIASGFCGAYRTRTSDLLRDRQAF